MHITCPCQLRSDFNLYTYATGACCVLVVVCNVMNNVYAKETQWLQQGKQVTYIVIRVLWRLCVP